MKRVHLSVLAIVGLLAMSVAGGAQAADLSIKAFFGKFQGWAASRRGETTTACISA